jgi:PLP dependent protein
MSHIAENLSQIRDRITTATQRAGRAADSVRLLAVSKTFPAEDVAAAVVAGQRLFGENRVQELQAKVPALPGDLEWHLIGHLQSNKVRKVLPLVRMIHSVSSLDLAKDISRISGELGLCPQVCLEVNVGAEGSKQGFGPEQLLAELETLCALPHLQIQGLMCIPPFELEPEATRPYFSRLRELRDECASRCGLALPTLSMGMSHDFEIAIAEGATIVRVGSALFGKR